MDSQLHARIFACLHGRQIGDIGTLAKVGVVRCMGLSHGMTRA